MSKKVRSIEDVDCLRKAYRSANENKYFNLFINNYEIPGMPEQERIYILKKFWNDGTIAGFPIKGTDLAGYAPYVAQLYNTYDYPAVIKLLNKKNIPWIPETPQVVGTDAVIGFILPNHKPMKTTLKVYIDKLTNLQMISRTNGQLQKMPYVIGVTQADREKAEDVVRRILNDEVAVYTDFQDLQSIQAIVTSAPYLLDKLQVAEANVENEIKTLLGIDNAPLTSGSKQLSLDTVNASNDLININRTGLENGIQNFLDDLFEVTGVRYTLNTVAGEILSVYEETGDEVAGGDNGGTENNGREKGDKNE